MGQRQFKTQYNSNQSNTMVGGNQGDYRMGGQQQNKKQHTTHFKKDKQISNVGYVPGGEEPSETIDTHDSYTNKEQDTYADKHDTIS